MLHTAFGLRAQARRAMPLFTSQSSMLFKRRSLSALPSSTMPKPPLITSPQPTPPPLCKLIQVAPRKASPTKFCTAMSAVKRLPSRMLAVSRYGLSVPLTSWWSRPSTMGAPISPRLIASLKACAMRMRPSLSAYRMRA